MVRAGQEAGYRRTSDCASLEPECTIGLLLIACIPQPIAIAMPLNDSPTHTPPPARHDLEPVVLVGQNGISPNLVAEFERALKRSRTGQGAGTDGRPGNARRDLDELAKRPAPKSSSVLVTSRLYYRRNAGKPGILLPG